MPKTRSDLKMPILEKKMPVDLYIKHIQSIFLFLLSFEVVEREYGNLNSGEINWLVAQGGRGG